MKVHPGHALVGNTNMISCFFLYENLMATAALNTVLLSRYEDLLKPTEQLLGAAFILCIC